MDKPGHELLRRCARVRLRAGDREAIARLAAAPLDWDETLRLAHRPGLRPLLYRHLADVAPRAVPRDMFAGLWARHEGLARRNRAMAMELLRILGAFAGEGVRAVPYKGPALAAALYGDVALREFGDLDILVRAADIPRARSLLAARGYVPEHSLAPAQEAALLRASTQYHIVMTRPRDAMVVELHWKTDPDHAIDRAADERWWDALPAVELEGTKVPAFSDRELLAILCLHGTRHYWVSLGWLVDVAELVGREANLDWEWIEATARSHGCVRRIGLGLHLAHGLLDAPVPESVLAWIARDPEVARLAQGIVDRLFDPGFAVMETFENFRFNLKLCERASQRLGHCARVAFAPSLHEWSRWPLPRPLFALYPPLRIARLAGKHLLGIRDSR